MLTLVLGDITSQAVDAIVNAANGALRRGGGVCGAIHAAAGPDLEAECVQVAAALPGGHLPDGGAVITGGYALRARHVIHAVGPVWHGGHAGEAETLASAYGESIARAREAGLRTIAFPSISTGIFGYPVDLAAPVALRTVAAALPSLGPGAEARFVLFDRGTFDAYRRAAEATLAPDAWRVGSATLG